MADRLIDLAGRHALAIWRRFRDMGDNSFAEVVALGAGEQFVGQTGFNKTTIDYEYTVVGGSYHQFDMIGNVAAPGVITLLPLAHIFRKVGGTGDIVAVSMTINKKGYTANWRLHFYNATPANLALDNSVWLEKYADRAARQGFIDLGPMSSAADAASDVSRVFNMNLMHRVRAAANDDSLYVGFEYRDVGNIILDVPQKFYTSVTVRND